MFVEGLSEWVARSPKEVYSLIQKGSAIRATGSTRMNINSYGMKSKAHICAVHFIAVAICSAPSVRYFVGNGYGQSSSCRCVRACVCVHAATWLHLRSMAAMEHEGKRSSFRCCAILFRLCTRFRFAALPLSDAVNAVPAATNVDAATIAAIFADVAGGSSIAP